MQRRLGAELAIVWRNFNRTEYAARLPVGSSLLGFRPYRKNRALGGAVNSLRAGTEHQLGDATAAVSSENDEIGSVLVDHRGDHVRQIATVEYGFARDVAESNVARAFGQFLARLLPVLIVLLGNAIRHYLQHGLSRKRVRHQDSRAVNACQRERKGQSGIRRG